jgi:hypothetical protein
MKTLILLFSVCAFCCAQVSTTVPGTATKLELSKDKATLVVSTEPDSVTKIEKTEKPDAYAASIAAEIEALERGKLEWQKMVDDIQAKIDKLTAVQKALKELGIEYVAPVPEPEPRYIGTPTGGMPQ